MPPCSVRPFFSTVALAANALLTSGDTKRPGVPAAGDRLRGDHRHAGLHRGLGPLGRRRHHPGRHPDPPTAGPSTGTSRSWSTAHIADLILVVGRTDAGLSLFGVKGDADGLTRTPLATMDQTRKQARLEFADTPAWLIGTDGGAEAGLSKTLDLAAVALAAEQVGGAQRCLESSVEYAKTRIQFGRPIGSFQAIKHKCADMLLEVESAKSAAYYAGWAAAEDSDELPVVASLAKSYCSEAYFHAAAETIQIHGGHRLHLGAPGPPLLQAGQVLGADARRSLLPPGAVGPAHRDLSRCVGTPVRDYRGGTPRVNRLRPELAQRPA